MMPATARPAGAHPPLVNCAAPAAVTGFYGHNVPYPGFGHTAGFIISTVIMVVLSVGLYVAFRRKDWL